MKFLDLDLHPTLQRALSDHGFDEATAVQEAVLAQEVRGSDLLVSSRTGSGKTVAFGLAIGDLLLSEGERMGPPGTPLALVVAPTRELALQVQRELRWLYAPAGGRIASCVGGMDVRREQRALHDGAHIVVGTPGRLCDHLERGTLDLSGLQAVVLDEADEMLDMGFRDDLERILEAAPDERRTLLFSATLPRGIEELAGRYQVDARRIRATSPEVAHQDIEYRAHLIAARETEHAVVNVLRYHDPARALVFGATREGVSRLSARLLERGFDTVPLSGELSQAERNRALEALRDGRARVLVATDVAARGLDLPEVGLVIHADLPMDASVLQHRSGRTGRAGRKGISVVLAPMSRRVAAERMLRAAKVEPRWTPVPGVEEIQALDSERVVEDLTALGQEVSEEDREVARRLLEERGAEELVAGLVKIQRAKRPAPEELPLTEAALARGKGARAARPVRGEVRPARGPRSTDDWAWFRLNVGRAANADPRWLVPLICRRGGISNREIGRIQILGRESRFQINPDVADAFAASVAVPDPKDPSIRIEKLRAGERPPPRPITLERPDRPGRLHQEDRAFQPAGKRAAAGKARPPLGERRLEGEEGWPSRGARARSSWGARRAAPPAGRRFTQSDDRAHTHEGRRFGEAEKTRPRPWEKRGLGEAEGPPSRPWGKRGLGETEGPPHRPWEKRRFGERDDRPYRPRAQPRADDADRPGRPRPLRTSGGRPITKRYGIGKGPGPSNAGRGKKK